MEALQQQMAAQQRAMQQQQQGAGGAMRLPPGGGARPRPQLDPSMLPEPPQLQLQMPSQH
jgi:hypothetical protein